MSHERAGIIGFDGIHRSGKGTQIAKLESDLEQSNRQSITVRGDGTRDGTGESPGDPYDPRWQEWSTYLRSEASTHDDWHASAYEIIHELHDHAISGDHHLVLADRSLVSRAALMLHSGANPGRKGFTLDDLYPVRERVLEERRVDILRTLPDILFYLEVKDPEVVMSRLDPSDPKYEFRSRNIQITFEDYRNATKVLPREVKDRLCPIDAALEEEMVYQKISYTLGEHAFIGLILGEVQSRKGKP